MKRIFCVLAVLALLCAFFAVGNSNTPKVIKEQRVAVMLNGNDLDIEGDFSVEDDWEFEAKCGDLTNNGLINAMDLAEMKKQLTGESEKSINIDIKDTNADSNFDILDLVRLKRYLADKSVQLG